MVWLLNLFWFWFWSFVQKKSFGENTWISFWGIRTPFGGKTVGKKHDFVGSKPTISIEHVNEHFRFWGRTCHSGPSIYISLDGSYNPEKLRF